MSSEPEASLLSLEQCRQQYEADLNRQTHCCLLTYITAENKEANRRIFNRLFEMQKDLIEVKWGKLHSNSASTSFITEADNGSNGMTQSYADHPSQLSQNNSDSRNNTHRHIPPQQHHQQQQHSSSSNSSSKNNSMIGKEHKSHHGKVKSSGGEAGHTVNYPEGLTIRSHRELQVILPIPDIHRVSDCDTIYRFLIARRMNEELAISDILHYIAFREYYGLNTVLWDREVESMYNGLDGEELLRSVIEMIASNKKGSVKGIKIPRPLLQPGWAVWSCGVDKLGHTLLYQRPVPKELMQLERRWPYHEGAYNKRAANFDSITVPYANLLIRLQMRVNEKGRRLARLLNYNNQAILRDVFKIDTMADPMTSGTTPTIQSRTNNAPTGSTNSVTLNKKDNNNNNSSVVKEHLVQTTITTEPWLDNGGGVTWLMDVGAINVSHFTSSKYKETFKVFRLVSLFAQAYYPENLFRLIIINGGLTFKLLYKLIRPWLDPQTQKKIILLSATNKASVEELCALDTASPISRDAKSSDVESSSGSNNYDKSHSSREEDNDDDDEDENNNKINNNSNNGADGNEKKNVRDKANYALHNALLDYIDDRFIPSIYGGSLRSIPAPLGYGGAVPRYLTEKPFYKEALSLVKRTVMPELLTDEFLFQYAKEGEEVTADEWKAFRAEMQSRVEARW